MLPTFGVIKAYESKKYFGHMFSVFLLGGVHHLLLLAKGAPLDGVHGGQWLR